jgi:hypothetical protein
VRRKRQPARDHVARAGDLNRRARSSPASPPLAAPPHALPSSVRATYVNDILAREAGSSTAAAAGMTAPVPATGTAGRRDARAAARQLQATDPLSEFENCARPVHLAWPLTY